jgi:hypothetical protein
MSILTCLGIALALLLYWLSGNEFARIVVFLLCVGFGLLIGQIPGGAIAGGIGWFASGIPIYYRRHKYNKWLHQPD